MDIEVRFVAGCPNLAVTREKLEPALDAIGRSDVAVQPRGVRTHTEADELGFTGSPTILIDGCDPFSEHHAAGGVSGSPNVEQLTAALGGADRT